MSISLNGATDGEQSGNGGKDGTLNGTLNSTEQKVFDCIKSTPGVNANTLIQQTDKSVRTIRRAVKQLIDNGLVEYRGSNKTGGYFLMKQTELKPNQNRTKKEENNQIIDS